MHNSNINIFLIFLKYYNLQLSERGLFQNWNFQKGTFSELDFYEKNIYLNNWIFLQNACSKCLSNEIKINENRTVINPLIAPYYNNNCKAKTSLRNNIFFNISPLISIIYQIIILNIICNMNSLNI